MAVEVVGGGVVLSELAVCEDAVKREVCARFETLVKLDLGG